MPESQRVLPLSGIRVIDFTRHMAGPYGTLFLSDYGADVVKIEPLPFGDGSRRVGVNFLSGESALYLMWNRGKRSVALDLRKPEAVDVVRRLASGADVLVENFRPGVATRIGIGYEQLAVVNPRLVYCSVSAFGPSGPLANHPGTDPVIQAMSGVMSVTGEEDGGPVLVGVPIADFTGAMLCAQAIMLGLLARDRTGSGQKVDVSMLHGLLSALTTRLANYWATGVEQRRHGSAHSVVVPYEAFKTADGYVVAGTWGEEAWPRFCNAIGRPDLISDPRFAINPERVKNRGELRRILQALFETQTTATWEERFRREEALFGPVLTIGQILEHEQVVQSGVLQQVEHAVLGSIPQLGPVIALRDTPGRIGGPPPLLGQHTCEVLAEAGYTAAEI